VELKELITIPNIAARLKVPAKTYRKMGPNKNAWCEFHQANGHFIRNFLSLAHQLDELVKSGFLKDYLQESQDDQALVTIGADQGHEVPVYGEVNTISGRFSRGGCSASQRKDSQALKRRVEYKYNFKLRPRQFQVVDPVMRKAHPYQLENKLSPKWIGPFKVTETIGNGTYRFKTLEGGAIPRTWNGTNLKFYFS